MEEFLGHSIGYWLELQKRVDEKDVKRGADIEEIVWLRGKISYYESRMKEMQEVSLRKTL